MNQETFLKELAAGLTGLSELERSRVLDYYREMICDGVENGKSEENVIQNFGSPQDIAEQILSEYNAPVAQVQPPVSDAQNYSARNQVGAVIVSAQNTSIQIQPVPDGPVRVLFTPSDSDCVTVGEQNGIFTFTHTMKHMFFHWRDIFRGPHSIVLQIPTAFHGDIRAETCNSKILADNLRGVGSCRFASNNARISVSNTDCSLMKLKTSNAPIHLCNIHGDTCNAVTNNSRITMEGCSFPAQLDLHTSNAAISIGSTCSENIILKTANAPISAMFVGDIREYAIHSHTSNGQNNLPSDWSFPGQTKHVSAVTSNSRIDVKFTAANG